MKHRKILRSARPSNPDTPPPDLMTLLASGLDPRRLRGFRLFQKFLRHECKIFEFEDDENVLYISATTAGGAYTVVRSLFNDRGTLKTRYVCNCKDFVKHGRSDCKHCFCERLRRGEIAVTDDLVDADRAKAARRRAPRIRFDKDGRTIRSSQREARVAMPARCPSLVKLSVEYVDKMSAYPKQRGTPLTIRAASLIHKVSYGLSADAMLSEYQSLIEKRILMLRKIPHQNSLTNWMNDRMLTPILMDLFRASTRPFRMLETAGAIDSTGLSQMRTAHYRGVKYLDDSRPGARWMKLHALAGTESNAILALEFTENDIHDINAYKPLIRSIKPLFNLQYILADKAYLSEEVLGWSKSKGITAIIPVKKRWDKETKLTYHDLCREHAAWYDERRQSFDEMYRYRAKIEAVFSLIKRMFDGYCWSRGRPNETPADVTRTAWINEAICKVIAHNFRCTVHLEVTQGILIDYLDPTSFFQPPRPEQQLLRSA